MAFFVCKWKNACVGCVCMCSGLIVVLTCLFFVFFLFFFFWPFFCGGYFSGDFYGGLYHDYMEYGAVTSTCFFTMACTVIISAWWVVTCVHLLRPNCTVIIYWMSMSLPTTHFFFWVRSLSWIFFLQSIYGSVFEFCRVHVRANILV